MKKLTSMRLSLLGAAVIGMAIVLPAPSADAQQYSPTTLSVTNVIPASSTNSALGGVITCTKDDLVAIQVIFKLMGAGTSAVTFGIFESLDGVTYDDTAVSTLSVTANGTTQVSGVVPISVGAVGFLKVGVGGNANASILTNLVVKSVTKPKRQG